MDPTPPADPPPQPDRRRELVARATLALLVVGLTLFVLLYRLLVLGQLEQTAALFIGLPGFLSLLVTLSPTPRSATGIAVKAVTLALLLAVVVLYEGAICVLMAAPLFYGVAIAIGLI